MLLKPAEKIRHKPSGIVISLKLVIGEERPFSV